MKYTVVFRDAALDELAELWTNAVDRSAISAAANRIDQLLRVDADRRGQPLNDERVLIVSPVAVVFTVSTDDCLVTVLKVLRVGS